MPVEILLSYLKDPNLKTRPVCPECYQGIPIKIAAEMLGRRSAFQPRSTI